MGDGSDLRSAGLSDGVFDQRIMYYGTEELWFPEWDSVARDGPGVDAPLDEGGVGE
jgi:hypothetical protein